jgi:hypothetical protein
MHERTNIRLSAADHSELEAVVANRDSPQKHVWRAKIVLLKADAHGTAEMEQSLRAITDIRAQLDTSGLGEGQLDSQVSVALPEPNRFMRTYVHSKVQGADLLEKRGWDDRPGGVSFASYSASRSLRTAAI